MKTVCIVRDLIYKILNAGHINYGFFYAIMIIVLFRVGFYTGL